MSHIFHIHLHHSINHVQRSLLSTWHILITLELGYKFFNLIPQNPNPHLFNSEEKLKNDSKSNEINLKQITIHLQIKNNENEQILCKSKIDYLGIFSWCLGCSNGKKKYSHIIPYPSIFPTSYLGLDLDSLISRYCYWKLRLSSR